MLVVLIAIIVVSAAIFNTRRARRISIGAWTEGFYDPVSRKLHPEALTKFESLIDKKISIAHYYRGWESWTDPVLVSEFNEIRSKGWTPMLSSNPYYFDRCPVDAKPLYEAIASGACDEFLHAAARNLRTVKHPFYLLFAWEMNNKDLEWSVPYTGSTSEQFVKAWRHIHTIFREEKVKNVIWVFNPNIPNVPDFPYTDLYPGADYVDWVGLDGYNWGTTQSWSSWLPFHDVFSGPYNELTRIAPEKPMVISEMNTTDVGGNKGEWYRDAFIKQIPENFPNIQAVIIFNENRTKQEKVNWKVDVTQESLDGFKQAVSGSVYR